jgi:hypothetical protein
MSRPSSAHKSTLSLIVIPTREVPGIGLELTPFPNIMGFENNLDTIRQEPLYNVLKMILDREKLLKVRTPDLYRGKSLKE